jgi:hypothetical protein
MPPFVFHSGSPNRLLRVPPQLGNRLFRKRGASSWRLCFGGGLSLALASRKGLFSLWKVRGGEHARGWTNSWLLIGLSLDDLPRSIPFSLQVKRLTSSLAFICQNFYKTFKFL